MENTTLSSDVYLAELERKRRRARYDRYQLLGLQKELEEAYKEKETHPPVNQAEAVSWKQELEDIVHDLALAKQDRKEATERFLECHREIRIYKGRRVD